MEPSICDENIDKQEMLDAFNNVHPAIKFTSEEEKDNSIAFLDVRLSRRIDGSDRCCYLDVVVGLAYRDEATELYWLEQPFLKVLPCQTGRLKSGKTKSNKPKVRRRSRTADCTEV